MYRLLENANPSKKEKTAAIPSKYLNPATVHNKSCKSGFNSKTVSVLYGICFWSRCLFDSASSLKSSRGRRNSRKFDRNNLGMENESSC